MIAQKTIEDIRFKADIVDIIGRYLPLKKKGRNYTGLCPFHHEKTPSFMVSPEKNIWHCFGCHKGGNVFNFVMEIEKLEFIDAVKHLAELTGVAIEEDESGEKAKAKQEKNILYEINQKAKEFFQERLAQADQNSPIREYLAKRKLTPEVIAKFELGYAPDSWNDLLNKLHGYQPEKVSDAGLAIRKEQVNEYYDRFRDRLMFPIKDVQGRVIGFSGRIISGGDKEQAKYVNSPETQIFNKGNNLYALNLAKEAIKQDDNVVLVEGQMDAIACHSAGLTNTIGSLGTAFTSNQARLLSRYTKNVVIAFDSDEAGRKAADRVIEILLPLGFNLKIIDIAEKDLDELLDKKGPQVLQEAVKTAKYYLEFKLDRAIQKHDLQDIAGRAKAAQDCVQILRTVEDKIILDHYLGQVSRRLKLNRELLQEELRNKISVIPLERRGFVSASYTPPPVHKYEKAEVALLKLLLEQPELRLKVFEHIKPEDFNPDWQAVLKYLNETEKSFDEIIADSNLSSEIRQKLASLYLQTDDKVERISYEDSIRLMQERQRSRLRQQLREELLQAERSGDEERANRIIFQLTDMKS